MATKKAAKEAPKKAETPRRTLPQSEVVRDREEVDELLNQCSESEDEGVSKFPGMSYEQGIRAGIDWLTGQRDENPMDD